MVLTIIEFWCTSWMFAIYLYYVFLLIFSLYSLSLLVRQYIIKRYFTLLRVCFLTTFCSNNHRPECCFIWYKQLLCWPFVAHLLMRDEEYSLLCIFLIASRVWFSLLRFAPHTRINLHILHTNMPSLSGSLLCVFRLFLWRGRQNF